MKIKIDEISNILNEKYKIKVDILNPYSIFKKLFNR